MKAIICIASLTPVLAMGLAPRIAAQEAAPASGKVLILTNDRVLEGEIDRVGSQFRVRRGAGEMLIAADRAKRLCADWSDALAYLRSQANLGDADERLRLARWCHQHGLKEDALIELRTALEMRPTHPETQQLAKMLGRAAAPPSTPPPPTAPKTASVSSSLDLSADAVAMFNTRIQPILLNACASCHANSQSGDFQLLRPGDGSARSVAQRNLAMAVAQLKLDNPSASPLLVKAVSAHGGQTQPPLRDRRVAPAQALQQWADQVTANNPHLLPATAQAAPLRSAPNAPTAPVTPVVSRTVERPPSEMLPPALLSVRDALVARMNPLQQTATSPSNSQTTTIDQNDAYSPRGFNELNTPRK